jgi:prevent-host-death family protein
VFVQDPNHKGAVAEAKIAAEAVALGIPVLKPVAEHGRYDLAFDLGLRILRVQCKWGARQNDVVCVRIAASWHSPTRGYVKTTYDGSQIDAIGVYCGELDRCYLLPIETFSGQSGVHLRLKPPRNGQRASLHWATEYEFNRGAIAQLGERLAGSQKVVGSSPTGSTSDPPSATEVKVGAHEFRNRFGWYMERAAAGEEFLVTRRGRPYVRLVSAPSRS